MNNKEKRAKYLAAKKLIGRMVKVNLRNINYLAEVLDCRFGVVLCRVVDTSSKFVNRFHNYREWNLAFLPEQFVDVHVIY